MRVHFSCTYAMIGVVFGWGCRNNASDAHPDGSVYSPEDSVSTGAPDSETTLPDTGSAMQSDTGGSDDSAAQQATDSGQDTDSTDTGTETVPPKDDTDSSETETAPPTDTVETGTDAESSTESSTEPSTEPSTESTGSSDTDDPATDSWQPTDPTGDSDTEETDLTTESSSDSMDGTDLEPDCTIGAGLTADQVTRFDVSGCENVTFDDAGHLVCITVKGNLISVGYPDSESVLYPNITGSSEHISARSARFLPDGNTLVYADRVNGALMRLDMTTLFQSPLVSGVVEPNGVAVHRNGTLYMTEVTDHDYSGGSVRRVDSVTGDNEIIFSTTERTLDGIALSPDYRHLYYSSEDFTLYHLPLNTDGTAAGNGEVLTTIVVDDEGLMGWMMADEIACDACGNIYMTSMDGPIYRVDPDGSNQMTVLAINTDFNDGDVIDFFFMTANAIAFGSGLGGWDARSIYVVSMDGGVLEVPVGVKGTVLPHLE